MTQEDVKNEHGNTSNKTENSEQQNKEDVEKGKQTVNSYCSTNSGQQPPINYEEEKKLLCEIETYQNNRETDANDNYKWFYRLGIILIVGESANAVCEAIFAGNKYVSYALAILTGMIGVITPILIFWNYVKRFEINTTAQNACLILRNAYNYGFGIFKRGKDLAKLAEKFSEIQKNYNSGKVEQIKQSSKFIENGK